MPQSLLSSSCDFPLVIYEAQFVSFPDKVRKGKGRIEEELKGRGCGVSGVRCVWVVGGGG